MVRNISVCAGKDNFRHFATNYFQKRRKILKNRVKQKNMKNGNPRRKKVKYLSD